MNSLTFVIRNSQIVKGLAEVISEPRLARQVIQGRRTLTLRGEDYILRTNTKRKENRYLTYKSS